MPVITVHAGDLALEGDADATLGAGLALGAVLVQLTRDAAQARIAARPVAPRAFARWSQALQPIERALTKARAPPAQRRSANVASIRAQARSAWGSS